MSMEDICETGPTVYSFHPTCHTKAALSPQLFKDPECWSGQSFDLTTSHTVVRCSTDLD